MLRPPIRPLMMCGIAWRKVAELQEIAGALVEADAPPSCGHVQPPGPCTLCAAGVPPRAPEGDG